MDFDLEIPLSILVQSNKSCYDPKRIHLYRPRLDTPNPSQDRQSRKSLETLKILFDKKLNYRTNLGVVNLICCRTCYTLYERSSLVLRRDQRRIFFTSFGPTAQRHSEFDIRILLFKTSEIFKTIFIDIQLQENTTDYYMYLFIL